MIPVHCKVCGCDLYNDEIEQSMCVNCSELLRVVVESSADGKTLTLDEEARAVRVLRSLARKLPALLRKQAQ